MKHLAFAVLLVAIAACGPPAASQSPSAGPVEVVLMTHDSFAISDDVLEAFQELTGSSVRVLKGGDAGAVVNQAILTRDNPLADVLFGVDNTFLSRAVDEGIFVPHQANQLDQVVDELRLDSQYRVTPIDYGDVCLNYDLDAFGGPDSPSAPATIDELADPTYRSMLVVENPSTSSPGLAFMLATIARFGEGGDQNWLDYWTRLRDNDVLVTSGWEEAYYSAFSGGAGEGDRPIVVSYATSPVAEVFFADPQPSEAPTGVVDDGCFRQVELAGVLAGAANPHGAQQLIDYMLGSRFQADIPLSMFVFPAVTSTDVPDVFAEHATTVTEPLSMDPATIAANRDRWLQEWTDVVLR